MKAILKNKKWGASLYLLFVFVVAIMSSCEPDSDLELPLNVNDYALTLKAEGGNTNVAVYSTGEWSVELEGEINWASLKQTRGEGNGTFNFAYSENFGTHRLAKVLLRRGAQTDTIKITQTGVDPKLSFPKRNVTVEKNASEVSVAMTTNLQNNFDDLKFKIFYDGKTEAEGFDGWVNKLSLEHDTIRVTVTPNNTDAVRTAVVQVEFATIKNDTLRTSFALTQSNLPTRNLSFSELRTLIPVAEGEYKFNDLVMIEGVVISDRYNLNMETNPNSARNNIDFSLNDRTAYVQSKDGAYGLRIQAIDFENNLFTRYDNVKLNLCGATMVKESNPERYTIKEFNQANIEERTSGRAGDVVAKSKYMRDLTDADLYTYVNLKDVEIVHSDGAYTNVTDGYAIGDATNGGCATPFFDVAPLTIRDINGNSMNMLTNTKVEWRRTFAGVSVPRGSGVFNGILVHPKLSRYGKDGYIGRYSIRPFDEAGIALAKSRSAGFSEILVEWNWNAAVATIKKDAAGNLLPDIGVGTLWQTERLNVAAHDDYNSPITHKDAYKGLLKNSAVYANSRWWNFTENRGEGWMLNFSTQGISTTNLSVDFTIGTLRASTTAFAPTYWKVDYSTDGVNFMVLPDSDFVLYPVVAWESTLPFYYTPGFHDKSFNLPLSLLGQPSVFVRIVASSTKCPSGDGADGGNVTATQAVNQVRLGCLAVRYNK